MNIRYKNNMVDLFRGNFLDVLPKLIDRGIKADTIILDIPYGTTNCKWDTPIDLKEMWKLLKKIRKDDTPIVMFAQTPFDKVLGVSNIKELKYEWVWEKTQATGHFNAKKMPMKAHENILVFYKKLPTYNYQKTYGHNPVNSFVKKIDVANKSEIYGKSNKEIIGGGNTDRYPRSVIKFKSDKQTNKLHPTQKPLALCEYLVNTYTNKGDLVLDIAMGSGTIGVASVKNGRRFIGIELDEEYFNVSKERVRNTETID